MTIAIDHYRGALERQGWVIEEQFLGFAWKVVGVRQEQSFVYVGGDRFPLWESAFANHCQVESATEV